MESNAAGVTEYALITALQAQGLFNGWVSRDSSLALFQKHFYVMHSLYRMQPIYHDKGKELFISPLFIQLAELPQVDADEQNVSLSSHALRDYYLDWSHFESATSESVTELLTNFWRKFSAVDEKAAALSVLDLGADAEWTTIQAQYRRLAAEHHPDKGGDRAAFMRIREAYESLKRTK